MRQLKHCLLAILLPAMNAFAQSPPENIRPLEIGDTVPDIVLTNVTNYTSPTINLSTLKGKLVILDFWASYCSSCIDMFPKINHLQEIFKDQVQVILVNAYKNDDPEKIASIFEKLKSRTGQPVTLPSSALQLSITSYFPHKYVPHYAWIDKNGKLVAMTTQFEVTKENIKSIIDGKNISLHLKKDQFDFNRNKPLLVDGNGGEGNEFLYRSLLTPFIEGIGNATGTQRNEENKIIRYYKHNTHALMLLREVYREKMDFPANRILIEARNPERFQYAGENSASYENQYCYEIIAPPSSWEELKINVQEDLNRMFRIRVSNEERALNCLIIKDGKHSGKLKTKGRDPGIDLDANSPINYLRNQSMGVFTDLLNSISDKMPVLNETGISENIDIVFPSKYSTLNQAALKQFLIQFGFEVTEEKRTLPVAVIRDR